MKTVFIRHGLTSGNLEKRYIGTTDEDLCEDGINQLKKSDYPKCELLVSSPMKRCIQTAQIIFHGQEILTYSGLCECDFGDFEGKNYIELSSDADYQKWVDSGGNLTFPNGEDPMFFRKRCIEAFENIVRRYKDKRSAAFVVHGGTIMSILEKYAVPHRDYYEWHCENGGGYICEWDGSKLEVMEKI